MNQQLSSSIQVSRLPSQTPDGTNFIAVEKSASGALLLRDFKTYIKHLQELKQSRTELEKAGYVMQPLTEDDLAQKRKCSRCHKCEYNASFSIWVASFLKTFSSDVQEGFEADQ